MNSSSYLKGWGTIGRASQVVAVHLPVAHICCGLPRQGVVQPVHVHRVVHDAPVGHRPDGAGVGPAVLEQQCGGEALLWLLVTLCLVSHVIHGSPVQSRSLGPHPGAFANGSPPLQGILLMSKFTSFLLDKPGWIFSEPEAIC